MAASSGASISITLNHKRAIRRLRAIGRARLQLQKVYQFRAVSQLWRIRAVFAGCGHFRDARAAHFGCPSGTAEHQPSAAITARLAPHARPTAAIFAANLSLST
jgi:hypothetical protein